MRDGLALAYDGSSSYAIHPPRSFDHWLGRQLQKVLAPARVRLELWDGSSPGLAARSIGDLVVRDRRTLFGLVFNPELAFGEAYTSGRMVLRGDMPRIVRALTRATPPGPPTLRERLALWLAPANDQLASRRNVHHHYDLGNDFYSLWLDPELVYTCACYPDARASLERAQIAKLDLVSRKLRLTPGATVVEAGCGWGALALHMAKQYGVSVRAFNLSSEQISYARERARREGLADRVEFVQDDYRNITGRFDVFVSVGMLEHIGRRSFDSLAEVLSRCVKARTGRALLHFIGRDHARPLNAWIRRRIFPGGYPPTLGEVLTHVLEPANLSVLDAENLRLHYARTLADWRTRFERAETTVCETFGPAFYRAWRLYLAGSEAAFRTGWLQLFQVVCAPAGGTSVHWLRPGKRF